jgi:uncharacterized LabA/DUF88 family protein
MESRSKALKFSQKNKNMEMERKILDILLEPIRTLERLTEDRIDIYEIDWYRAEEFYRRIARPLPGYEYLETRDIWEYLEGVEY